jgi:hypothetical protein
MQGFVVNQPHATQRAAQELFLFRCWVKAVSVGALFHASHSNMLPVKPSWKDGVSTQFFDDRSELKAEPTNIFAFDYKGDTPLFPPLEEVGFLVEDRYWHFMLVLADPEAVIESRDYT